MSVGWRNGCGVKKDRRGSGRRRGRGERGGGGDIFASGRPTWRDLLTTGDWKELQMARSAQNVFHELSAGSDANTVPSGECPVIFFQHLQQTRISSHEKQTAISPPSLRRRDYLLYTDANTDVYWREGTSLPGGKVLCSSLVF